MPASLPGSTLVQNQANPTLGQFVLFDPLSGPKGSPLDAVTFSGAYDAQRLPVKVAAPGNCSTGMLSTGIGIGANHVINVNASVSPATPPWAIFRAKFDDNHIPGERTTVYAAPPPPGVVVTDVVDSKVMYIGGGKSAIVAGTGPNGNGYPASWNVSSPVPYVAGIALVGAGNGGSRDGGAGPAFTGFPLKMVTAVGAVANGADIEVGFANRSGVAMVATESAFGSAGAQLAAPA